MLIDDVKNFFRWLPQIERDWPHSDVVLDLLEAAVPFDMADPVIHAGTTLASTRPTAHLEAIENFRLPYPVTWIEYSGVVKAAASSAISPDDPDAIPPARIGALIFQQPQLDGEPRFPNPDAADRKYRIMVFWRDQDRKDPVTAAAARKVGLEMIGWSPAIIHLDTKFVETGMSIEDVVEATRNSQNAFTKYVNNAQEMEAYRRSVQMRPWSAIPDSDKLIGVRRHGIDAMVNDAAQEFASIVGCMLLLNSPRATNFEKVDMSRLNRQREKAKKTPLTSYTEIRLTGKYSMSDTPRAWPEDRAAARAHLVRGHFKRLEDPNGEVRMAWWSPHVRGAGKAPTRKPYVVTQAEADVPDDEPPTGFSGP